MWWISIRIASTGWRGLFAVEKSPDAFLTLQHNLINTNSNFAWPEWLPKTNHDINNVIKLHQKNLKALRVKFL